MHDEFNVLFIYQGQVNVNMDTLVILAHQVDAHCDITQIACFLDFQIYAILVKS